MLTAALQEQATWEQRRRSAKELLNEMLASRREAAELAKSYDTRCAPAAHNLIFICLACERMRALVQYMSLPASGFVKCTLASSWAVCLEEQAVAWVVWHASI